MTRFDDVVVSLDLSLEVSTRCPPSAELGNSRNNHGLTAVPAILSERRRMLQHLNDRFFGRHGRPLERNGDPLPETSSVDPAT